MGRDFITHKPQFSHVLSLQFHSLTSRLNKGKPFDSLYRGELTLFLQHGSSIVTFLVFNHWLYGVIMVLDTDWIHLEWDH